MYWQEATRAVIVCGLRAGHNMKEIISYGNINKSSVYDVEKSFEKLIASGGSADTVLTGRKRTVLAPSLDKLITRDLGRSPPPQRRRWTFPEQIWDDSVEGCTYIAWNHHYSFQQERQSCPRQQKDAGLAQESFTEVWVEEVWPPSFPFCKTFWLFFVRRLSIKGQCKVS